MKRQVIRVEPLSSYLERWIAPTCASHGTATGEVAQAPIERQTELVLEQLKLCVEAAGLAGNTSRGSEVVCAFGLADGAYERCHVIVDGIGGACLHHPQPILDLAEGLSIALKSGDPTGDVLRLRSENGGFDGGLAG